VSDESEAGIWGQKLRHGAVKVRSGVEFERFSTERTPLNAATLVPTADSLSCCLALPNAKYCLHG